MSSPPPGRCDVEEYLARDLSRVCFQRKIRFQRITPPSPSLGRGRHAPKPTVAVTASVWRRHCRAAPR